jgi:hypothetical protein
MGHTMKRRCLPSLAVAILLVIVAFGLPRRTAAQSAKQAPLFQVDPDWLKLPNNWVMGIVSAVAVDKHDNVWVMHRPRTVPDYEKKTNVAPSVLEFDAKGKFVQAWGWPTTKELWPIQEHCMYIDDKDNIWIGGTGRPTTGPDAGKSDDYLQKFSPQGKLLMQIGQQSASKGPQDMVNMHGPADVFYYAKTNEVFVGDEGNLRVIVYDADSGKFKRMWAGSGEAPPEKLPVRGRGAAAPGGGAGAADAAPAPPAATTGPGPKTFASTHAVQVANDGMVYVADRANSRIQVFTLEGKYVTQVFINRGAKSNATASGITFSRDPEQRFMYVTDYGNNHVYVMDRKSLDVLYRFGNEGTAPGDFRGPHIMAFDSKNNLYVSEVDPGNRLQRFLYKGLGPAPTQ